MSLSAFLSAHAVLPRLRAPTLRALFTALAEHAAPLVATDALTIANALAAREAAGTTGFGGGVALPHARLPGLAWPTGLFARLQTPLDYGALDSAPVDLVFMLLSPAAGSAAHLKALARASRLLRDPALRARLRGAADASALHALLAGPPLAAAA